MAEIFSNGSCLINVRGSKSSKIFAAIEIDRSTVTLPVLSISLTATPRVSMDQSLAGDIYVAAADGNMCTGELSVVDGAFVECNKSSKKLYGGLLDILKLHKNKTFSNRVVRITIYSPSDPTKSVGVFKGAITSFGVTVGRDNKSSCVTHTIKLSLTGVLE